jgi:hypothetical protein
MSKRDARRKQVERRGTGAQPDEAEDTHEQPGPPADWRDVVRTDYGYPDGLEDLRRRERRRAKRDWRRDDHAQRMAWLRERRQAEPSSPVAVIVAVAILAIIVLGIGGGLPRLLRGEEPGSREVGLLTPSLPPSRPSTTDRTVESSSQSIASPTSPPTAPPVLTERPSAAATTAASDAALNWARTFYTRDPASETYDQLVARTAQFTTPEVAESFTAAGDSTYEALKADGGRSTVISAPVAAPQSDSAPVDTPTRISRLVTVTIDISGKQPDVVTLPLVVTLVPQGSKWVISNVNGGSGP